MGLIEPLFLSNTLLGASISDPLDDFLNTLGTLGTSPTRWWHQDAPTLSHLRKEETALKKDFTLLLWGEQGGGWWEKEEICACATELGDEVETQSHSDCELSPETQIVPS